MEKRNNDSVEWDGFLKLLERQADADIANIQTHADLEAVRRKWIGRNGILKKLYKRIG